MSRDEGAVPMRIDILTLATMSVLLLSDRVALADDPVTFHADEYGCSLRIDGREVGRIEPNAPKTIPLPRGREYLVECESHDIPVKLYARNYLFSRGDFRNGPLANEVRLLPVAVLPNIIKAVAAQKLTATTLIDSKNVGCQNDPVKPDHPWEDKSHQISPEQQRVIPKGTAVELTPTSLRHCGDTNLIEVRFDGWTDWFRNRDFEFSYQGKKITLFPVSQDLDCCWIE
jgi:hypothetical protein